MTTPGRTLFDRLREMQAQGDASARVDRGTRGVFEAQEFGAIGDGTSRELSTRYATLAEAQVDYPCATALTDELDWAAIQTACDAAGASMARLTAHVPPGTYKINQTVTVGPWTNFVCDGTLVYNGPQNRAAVVIGSADYASTRTEHKVAVQSEDQSDWSDGDYIGVQLINHSNSQFNITAAIGFTVGLQCLGQGKGFAYNEVHLGILQSNQVGLDCANVTYEGDNGWCNENLFHAGRFTVSSGLSGAGDRWGVRIRSLDVSPQYNNNLVFVKPSFELASTTGGYPLRLEHATRIRVISARSEGNHNTISAQVLNESQYPDIDWGWGSAMVDDQSTYRNTRETHRILQNEFHAARLIFHSGAVHKTWCYYDGQTTIHVPRCHWGASSNANVYSNAQPSAIAASYVELGTTRALGVRVVCHSARRFCVKLDVEASYPGRIVVRCYDAAGSVLSGTSPWYIYFSSHRTFAAYASYGGSYRTGADSQNDCYFMLDPAVYEFDVFVVGGTAACRVRSFSVLALDGFQDASAYVGYEEVVPGANIGSAAPTAWTWAHGKMVWNAAPVSGGTQGWVCTAAGTPGTWKACGVIA